MITAQEKKLNKKTTIELRSPEYFLFINSFGTYNEINYLYLHANLGNKVKNIFVEKEAILINNSVFLAWECSNGWVNEFRKTFHL